MANNKQVEKEIRFVGLQRSGNHAVINWILQQCTGDYLFFNDVDPLDPLNERRLTEGNLDIDKYECVLYSFEDRLLNTITSAKCYPLTDSYRLNVKKRYDILIMRDPYNLFASRSNHNVVLPKSSHYVSGLSIPNLWITYAKEYLNETSLLNNNKIVINYNRWCISKQYRKEIAEKLELTHTDAGFNDIPDFGDGSSFNKRDYNNKAIMMKTDSRWKYVGNQQEYLSLFRDKKLVDISNKIFDVDNDLENFIEKELKPKFSIYASWSRILQILFVPRIITFARESNIVRYIYFNFLLKKRQDLLQKKRDKLVNKVNT